MTDTHINAYFGAVAEAEQEVEQAKAKLAAAKSALEVKKKEDGWVEETPQENSKEQADSAKSQPVEDTKGKDSKKK